MAVPPNRVKLECVVGNGTSSGFIDENQGNCSTTIESQREWIEQEQKPRTLRITGAVLIGASIIVWVVLAKTSKQKSIDY